jgi:GAF domain-containing protein
VCDVPAEDGLGLGACTEITWAGHGPGFGTPGTGLAAILPGTRASTCTPLADSACCTGLLPVRHRELQCVKTHAQQATLEIVSDI